MQLWKVLVVLLYLGVLSTAMFAGTPYSTYTTVGLAGFTVLGSLPIVFKRGLRQPLNRIMIALIVTPFAILAALGFWPATSFLSAISVAVLLVWLEN